MKNIFEYYQGIPLNIDPIAFSIGSFAINWYSLMYITAFVCVYLLLQLRINKKEIAYSKVFLTDFLLFIAIGVLIGGRLGYVFLYNPTYYWHNWWAIFSPYDFSTERLTGIYGMSYHGGVIGVAVAAWVFARHKKIDFWQLLDFVIPAIPAGYFFGRIGNFLNLELYGRVTENWSGMYFPLWTGAGELLRYPSQLFEAFLEGALLFIILWSIRNKNKFGGYLTALYLVGYGSVRIIGEFFREPDRQIGFIGDYFTLGQLLSTIMIVVGAGIYFRKKVGFIKK